MDINRMINSVMAHLPNYFIQDQPRESGLFTLANGLIILEYKYASGSRILFTGGNFAVGSYKILSVQPYGDKYQYALEGLENVSDEWTGIIYGQRVPPDFIHLCERISEWCDKNSPSNITGENVINEFSFTRATDKNGIIHGWQKVFADELRRYRTQMMTNIKL